MDNIYKNISNAEFSKLMRQGKSELLDIRSIEEFQAVHIKGAKLIEFDHIDFEEIIDDLDKEKSYLLYCRSGRRSFYTMELMQMYGFKEVYNLKDGIIKWEEEETLIRDSKIINK